MIFNSSSDGALPNFSIVGGTKEPTTRSYNTIWVKTSINITGYAFDNDEPTNPYDGMVWIKTGDDNIDAFSVFEPSTTMVFPSKTFQYSSGVWKPVYAKRYHDSVSFTEWLDGIIFKENYDKTEWTIRAQSSSSSTYAAPSFTTSTYNGVTCKYIGAASGTSSVVRGTVITTDTVDLTLWDKLTVTVPRVVNSSGQNTSFRVCVWKTPTDSSVDAIATKSITFTATSDDAQTLELNVSELDGSYYVGFYFLTNRIGTYGVYISEIRLS